jgi:hypothetical protein
MSTIKEIAVAWSTVKLKHWILHEAAQSFLSQHLSKFSQIASQLNQRSPRKRVVYHAVPLKATSGFVTVCTDLARANTRARPPVKFVTSRCWSLSCERRLAGSRGLNAVHSFSWGWPDTHRAMQLQLLVGLRSSMSIPGSIHCPVQVY